MTWSAPMTAVAGATFSAAEFNQYVRDNLNETAPAKATAASQLFVSTGANAIATRVPTAASIVTAESTTSDTYVNLTTVGPSVTVTTGTIAIVLFAASHSLSGTDRAGLTSVAVSGASSVAASDNWSILTDGVTAGNYVRSSGSHVFTGLTPGSNTFRLQYRRGAGAVTTATFQFREISVIPL